MAAAAKKIKIAQDQVLEAEKQYAIPHQVFDRFEPNLILYTCLTASRQAFSNGSPTIC